MQKSVENLEAEYATIRAGRANPNILNKIKVEYWARLRDKLEDDKISETEYYLKEIKYPMNPTDPNKEYTVSLNLDDDDQLLIQNMNEDNDAEETAELLKDLFPDFSYVKRKRKPKKE